MTPSATLTSTATNLWHERSLDFLRQTVLNNPFIPHCPTPKQGIFLSLIDPEALFGGAAGGGKSDALLMGALQFANVPGYSAILFRRTFSDLNLPGGLIPRSLEWLTGKARWNATNHVWTFPSGATLSFGYLENEADKFRYQSSEFQFIGFDELTQFIESSYLYLFSRLRRHEGMPVPLRMRSASNPGGRGHAFAKRRFITEGRANGRWFIPARLTDNPHLDQAGYRGSLANLDHVTRKQLEEGDWDVSAGGLLFKREWFETVETVPVGCRTIRYWDRAATEPSAANPDPDYTAGVKLSRAPNGVFYVEHVSRFRGTPARVEDAIRNAARADGLGVSVGLETDPGQAGIVERDHLTRALTGFVVVTPRPMADKETRARPVSSAAEHGNVKLVRGSWNEDFLAEIEAFPLGDHDDQVDALSGAFNAMAETVPLWVV